MSGTAVGSRVWPGSVSVGDLPIPAAPPARRAGCPRAPARWRRTAGPRPSSEPVRYESPNTAKSASRPNGVGWPQKHTRVQRRSIAGRAAEAPSGRAPGARASRRPRGAPPTRRPPGPERSSPADTSPAAPFPYTSTTSGRVTRPPRRSAASNDAVRHAARGRRCSTGRSPCSPCRGSAKTAHAPTGTRRPAAQLVHAEHVHAGVDRVEGAERILAAVPVPKARSTPWSARWASIERLRVTRGARVLPQRGSGRAAGRASARRIASASRRTMNV